MGKDPVVYQIVANRVVNVYQDHDAVAITGVYRFLRSYILINNQFLILTGAATGEIYIPPEVTYIPPPKLNISKCGKI